jgi:putative peptide zinc metalloprotease protein
MNHNFHDRLTIDTSEGETVYLLTVGNPPTYVRLSSTSYYLLYQRSIGTSYESLAEVLTHQGQNTSPEQVEAAYHKVIEKITQIEQDPKLKHKEFFFRFTLLPKFIVQPIAKYLSIAFVPPVVYSLLSLIGFAIAIAPYDSFLLNLSPTGFFWSYLLFLGSLLMHEFGHASACSRYGASPSDIGFTVYLIWPAFYSDVSDAWKLKRWQRVVVDIGGVFFQLVIAALYVIIFTFTGWEPIKLVLLMIAGSCLFTLNPIFKFDGYWLLADSLGITNLSQQPARIFRHTISKLRGKTTQPLPWPLWIIVILSIYTILTGAIWLEFLWLVIPMFAVEWNKYPTLVLTVIPKIFHWPIIVSMVELQSFTTSTFFFVIGVLSLRRIISSVFMYLFKIKDNRFLRNRTPKFKKAS